MGNALWGLLIGQTLTPLQFKIGFYAEPKRITGKAYALCWIGAGPLLRAINATSDVIEPMSCEAILGSISGT
jgi:hypothetical protein